MSSANSVVLLDLCCGMSLMNTENSSGEMQDPCGTPAAITVGDDRVLSILTRKVLPGKKDFSRLTRWLGTPDLMSLKIRPSCQTLSNAFTVVASGLIYTPGGKCVFFRPIRYYATICALFAFE